MTPGEADRSDLHATGDWGAVDLSAVWEASRGVLREQVLVIERAVVAGIERRLDLEEQREAGREAHKLAGSLGTFGFEDGSLLARSLELVLMSTEVLDPAGALAVSGLVVELQDGMAGPLSAPPNAPTADPISKGRLALLVVDADAHQGRRVVEVASGQAMRAASVVTLDAARAVIATNAPTVVVLDVAVGGDDDVSAFLDELVRDLPGTATVVIVGRAGVGERVEMGRLGAQAVLQRPAAPDVVVDAVSRILARWDARSTVLVVDDDPTLLVLVGELLRAEGVAVETIDDGDRLWASLEAFKPDLLLLDNDMPGFDGISLCRAIRGDDRWVRLPVVFLSGTDSPGVVGEMFAAGADDYIAKPVSPDDFVSRVTNRIRRSRAQAARSDVDPATGLPSASSFIENANRLLRLARRDGRPAVLAIVELDPPSPSALATFGRLLRQATTTADSVGAWSGGRLAAVLHGTTAAEGESRLRRVVGAARGATGVAAARVSVGLAACPEDGRDVRALGAAAETALGRALQATGDAVEAYETLGQARAVLVDVLLVDDDEALGTLVVHALSGRGFSVRWLRDGAEAVELLDDPGFRARVVLLDVALPGLDGLSVLRHLAHAGRLGPTRVVMLTVRANEGEVLEALDLGAFDHVAKPFSLSVLMHRVRRAIEASGDDGGGGRRPHDPR